MLELFALYYREILYSILYSICISTIGIFIFLNKTLILGFTISKGVYTGFFISLFVLQIFSHDTYIEKLESSFHNETIFLPLEIIFFISIVAISSAIFLIFQCFKNDKKH